MKREPVMARQESDREDLMAEATALRPRIELTRRRDPVRVVAGRRAGGGWSVYFGADPVFHFDDEGRLRRAYVEDNLYRTQGTTLAELTRMRTENETRLQRRDLSATERNDFLTRMRHDINGLNEDLQAGDLTVLRCVADVPSSVVLDELRRFLQRVINVGTLLAPRISGKQ